MSEQVEKKSAKQVKQTAQDALANGMYGAILNFSENYPEEKVQLLAMVREARRVLKLWGIDPDSLAWACADSWQN